LTVVEGYFKNSFGQPEKCHENCEKCDGTGATKCTLCKVSFLLSKGECLPCQ
jgi:hypothetical protein